MTKTIDRKESAETETQIVEHEQVISAAPGSLERVLMTLRRRKFEILHLEVEKKGEQYLLKLTLKTDRPDRLQPLLNRLWDVRKCES
jgi:acetolactate synthase regulatory subunit